MAVAADPLAVVVVAGVTASLVVVVVVWVAQHEAARVNLCVVTWSQILVIRPESCGFECCKC